jgi:hypothetical protein
MSVDYGPSNAAIKNHEFPKRHRMLPLAKLQYRGVTLR